MENQKAQRRISMKVKAAVGCAIAAAAFLMFALVPAGFAWWTFEAIDLMLGGSQVYKSGYSGELSCFDIVRYEVHNMEIPKVGETSKGYVIFEETAVLADGRTFTRYGEDAFRYLDGWSKDEYPLRSWRQYESDPKDDTLGNLVQAGDVYQPGKTYYTVINHIENWYQKGWYTKSTDAWGYETAEFTTTEFDGRRIYHYAAPDFKVIVDGWEVVPGKSTEYQTLIRYATPAKLLSVTNPSAITVPNGTAIAEMGLPETVTISTENAEITSAPVTWDTVKFASGSYNINGKSEQHFTLRGSLSLPDKVYVDKVSAEAYIDITVLEAPVQDESMQTGNQLDDRKDLSLLLATGKEASKTSIKLSWLKYQEASGYEVYWSFCDGKRNFKKTATVKSGKPLSYVHKKLKTDRAYKYFIVAYKMVKGNKVYLSKSPNVHVAMSFNAKTNAKSISVKQPKVVLKKGRTTTIKATAKLQNKKKEILSHARPLRYYTNDKSVASVSSSGLIRGKNPGKCSVFVIANNGVYKKVSVTVK